MIDFIDELREGAPQGGCTRFFAPIFNVCGQAERTKRVLFRFL